MRPLEHKQAHELVHAIHSNYCNRNRAPIFLFGAGASITSGYPTSAQFLEKLRKVSGAKIGEWGELLKKVQDKTIHDAFFQEFVPQKPSRGYLYLTQLIRYGYFPIVLTTNWDLVLETELRKWISPEKLIVHVRPTHSDESIARSLSDCENKVHLIRLHGDTLTQLIYANSQLMEFHTCLETVLRDEIMRRGIIVAGYGLTEPLFFSIIKKPNFLVYANHARSQLSNHLPAQNCFELYGDDGMFDLFLEGITRELLKIRLKDRIRTEGGRNGDPEKPTFRSPRTCFEIDDIVEKLSEGLNRNDFSESDVERFVEALVNKLINHFRRVSRSKVCLLFVNDPEAPGGIEVQRVIERAPALARDVRGFIRHTVNVEGRSGGPRTARLCPDELRGFEYIVLIDSIAFSGNTLNVIREKLKNELGYTNNQIIAAPMLISRISLPLLKDKGWDVIWGTHHDEPILVCPWGVTRPTKPVRPPKPEYNDAKTPLAATDFLPLPYFDLIPKPWGEQRSFCENEQASVRLFELDRSHRTSLHYHVLRDEIFVVLDDRVRIQLWDRFQVLRKHEAIRIPAGVPHCLIALDQSSRILEISIGLCDQEKDIFRLEDKYERPGLGVNSNGLV